jgi:ABC transporter
VPKEVGVSTTHTSPNDIVGACRVRLKLHEEQATLTDQAKVRATHGIQPLGGTRLRSDGKGVANPVEAQVGGGKEEISLGAKEAKEVWLRNPSVLGNSLGRCSVEALVAKLGDGDVEDLRSPIGGGHARRFQLRAHGVSVHSLISKCNPEILHLKHFLHSMYTWSWYRVGAPRGGMTRVAESFGGTGKSMTDVLQAAGVSDRTRALESAPDIRLAGVSKQFGTVRALEPTDLTINRGEFFSLLGASGSGKTTTLRIIAGFEEPSTGKVYLQNRDFTLTAPYERNVNTVFQDYALFPHMSVEDNVAYGLRVRRTPKQEMRRRVAESLALVRVSGFEK